MRQYLPQAFSQRIHCDPYFWNVDHISHDGTYLYISGWALPFAGIPKNFQLVVNGIVAESVITNRQGVAEQYPWWPNSLHSGFSARVSLDDLSGFEPNSTELRLVAVPVWGPTPDSQMARELFVVLGAPSDVPPDNLRATIGGPGEFAYRRGGRTLYRAFEATFLKFGSTSLRDADVFDWGCGPGRIATHMVHSAKPKSLSGSDIVATAIDWVGSHVPGTFKVCDTTPPLPFDTASFDFVYSYSVFTHIPADLVGEWVVEISRILRSDGIFLTTVLGELAAAKFRLYFNPAVIEDWINAGISDDVSNNQLANTNVKDGYYRNVFMTKEMIHKMFGNVFEIIEIKENFHSYQDMIVMRKRKS